MSGRTARITVILPVEMAAAFKRLCDREGISMSDKCLSYIYECLYGSRKGRKLFAEMENRQFVYLMRSENNYYKIGRARCPEARCAALCASIPFKIEVLESVQVSNACAVERRLHEIFANKRVIGEWFSLSRSDVNSFERVVKEVAGIWQVAEAIPA